MVSFKTLIKYYVLLSLLRYGFFTVDCWKCWFAEVWSKHGGGVQAHLVKAMGIFSRDLFSPWSDRVTVSFLYRQVVLVLYQLKDQLKRSHRFSVLPSRVLWKSVQYNFFPPMLRSSKRNFQSAWWWWFFIWFICVCRTPPASSEKLTLQTWGHSLCCLFHWGLTLGSFTLHCGGSLVFAQTERFWRFVRMAQKRSSTLPLQSHMT